MEIKPMALKTWMRERVFHNLRHTMKIEFYFEPRDLWIGVYWDRKSLGCGEWLHVYVCLVPTLCIHWWGRLDDDNFW
jgi:hypothetical protein